MGDRGLLHLIGLKMWIILTSLHNIVILGAQGLLMLHFDGINIFDKDDLAACSFILMFCGLVVFIKILIPST